MNASTSTDTIRPTCARWPGYPVHAGVPGSPPRSRGPRGGDHWEDALSVDTKQTRPDTASTRAGTITLILALLFLFATAFTYVLSLSEGVNPANWVRALGLVWLPIGFFGAPIAYSLARTGPGRHRGRIGLAVLLVGVVAFVVLQFIAT